MAALNSVTFNKGAFLLFALNKKRYLNARKRAMVAAALKNQEKFIKREHLGQMSHLWSQIL